MIGCVLSQLKPSELCILSFFIAKNVELLGLYPIRKDYGAVEVNTLIYYLFETFYTE